MKYTSTYISDLTNIQNACLGLEKIKNTKVLVTGSTGLICSAIIDFLINLNDTADANVTVYVTARNREKAEKRFGERMNRSDMVFVEYDALKIFKWDFDVDYIIHGASPANPALYARQPVETMLTNIIGLNNMLEYAKSHKTKRVLFISSSEVYGNKTSKNPYQDTEYGYVDILNPRACYPISKRACETLCASYREEYGLNTVTVRLGHIYGPTANRSDTRASSQFFFNVIDGQNIVMKSDGSQIRSYCYVMDCISAIITVLLIGETGKAYNVSNPLSVVTIRELAEEIAKCSGKEVVFENPSDEEKKGYNLMSNSSLDSSQLIRLGWNGKYTLTEGVEHTFDILKE